MFRLWQNKIIVLALVAVVATLAVLNFTRFVDRATYELAPTQHGIFWVLVNKRVLGWSGEYDQMVSNYADPTTPFSAYQEITTGFSGINIGQFYPPYTERLVAKQGTRQVTLSRVSPTTNHLDVDISLEGSLPGNTTYVTYFTYTGIGQMQNSAEALTITHDGCVITFPKTRDYTYRIVDAQNISIGQPLAAQMHFDFDIQFVCTQ